MDVVTLLAAVLVNALPMSLALVVSVGMRVRSGLQSWQFMLLRAHTLRRRRLVIRATGPTCCGRCI